MGHRKSICSLHHGRRKLRQEFVFHALHIRLFPEIVKLKGIRFSVIEIPRSHHIHLDVIRPLPQRPHLPALGPGVETVETVPLRRYRIFGPQRQSIVLVPILSGKSALRISSIEFPLRDVPVFQNRKEAFSLAAQRRLQSKHIAQGG